jgi:predicted metal-dependent HD superfamily phosphohydrolase
MIGLGPLLLGCAILTAHSKGFRRGLQQVRHRSGWVSERLDRYRERGPRLIRHMVHRTRPSVLLRHARMRARHKSA